RVGYLVGLLDRVGRDRRKVLLEVPRTACDRRAQRRHDLNEAGNIAGRGHGISVAWENEPLYAASGAAIPAERTENGQFPPVGLTARKCYWPVMSDQPSSETALVLFSGGQDSTTCLAWALQRFARVEMLGFDYGQRHAIELECRERLLNGIKLLRGDWAAKLGQSHTLAIPTVAEISDTALTG